LHIYKGEKVVVVYSTTDFFGK